MRNHDDAHGLGLRDATLNIEAVVGGCKVRY